MQVDLDFWQDRKEFTITYVRQAITMSDLVNAEMVRQARVGSDTVVKIQLWPQDYLHGAKPSLAWQISRRNAPAMHSIVFRTSVSISIFQHKI